MLDAFIGLVMFTLGMGSVKGDSDVQEVIETTTSVVSDQTSPGSKSKRSGPILLNKENIKTREDTLQSVFEKRNQKITTELKTTRDEMKKKMESERAQLKEKISQLKDTRKKQLLTKVDTNLATVNKNRTDALTTHLSTMSEILDKLGVRVSEAKNSGADVVSVEEAIAQARSLIATAQSAVTIQAGKTYVPTVASEQTVKDDVRLLMESFKNDIRATHSTVMAAKQSVVDAMTAFKTVVQNNQTP